MNQIKNVTAITSSTAANSAAQQRIAFIQAGWHGELVGQCREGFFARMAELGFPATTIDCFTVPGGLEIPLQAKLLAKTGRYAAIVAAGLVVDGGIYRHEFVADAIIKAFMQVQLELEIPIISAVLTPHHFHEHETHQGFFHGHLRKKGEEAAGACVQMLGNLRELAGLSS